ncbi:MAG: hypothetical protein CL607_28680 [Anaerolineaceae bacterium]|nr:hypothetical protein [Anaerolineaceae bacterium]
MFAQKLRQEEITKTIAVLPNTVRGIVTYEGEVLPQGNWSLTIESGRAWVFCNDRNVPLHKGQTLELRPEDGDVQIRALYARGIAAYEAARQ